MSDSVNPFNMKDVLAGSYLPRSKSNHLSLAALCEGESRARLIQNLIDEYLSNRPIEMMIEVLASNAIETWKSKDHFRRPFTVYLEREIRPRLERRKLAEKHIMMIIKRAGELINGTDEKAFVRKHVD